MRPVASLGGKASPLSLRLLLVIILSSAILTLILTAIQLALEYRADVEHIELRLEEIEISYLDSITQSLWNFNEEQYRVQLKGILSLQDVVYVEIRGPQGALIAAAGQGVASAGIINRIPLRVENFGHALVIGELVIFASLERVYRNLLYRGLVILLSQAIKTILISTVIILAFYYLVARHVRFIADYLKQLDVRSDEQLVLTRRRPLWRKQDELDVVTDAINEMKRALRASYEQVHQLNAELESKVEARTEELEQANRRLAQQNNALTDSQRNLRAQKEQLDFLANHDSLLTMLYNRRGFTELMTREWRDCLRRGEPLTVALLDIDHFKLFNDRYGHQAGDDALLQVAAVLAEAVRRPRDGAARYGGEEFVVFLPETDLHGARFLLEHVRAQVEALAIPHASSPIAAVLTVSIGCISATPTRNACPEALIRQADQLLYRAKQQGRNRVLCEP